VIQYEETKALLLELGERSTVNPFSPAEDTCLYHAKGGAMCIVGTLMHEMDLPLPRPSLSANRVSLKRLPGVVENFDNKAIELLLWAQQQADGMNGTMPIPWDEIHWDDVPGKAHLP
jgi:hypothetical protein